MVPDVLPIAAVRSSVLGLSEPRAKQAGIRNSIVKSPRSLSVAALMACRCGNSRPAKPTARSGWRYCLPRSDMGCRIKTTASNHMKYNLLKNAA